MTHFYATENANPLRGLYSLSERAPLAYENARDTVAKFINAHEAAEIVFTRNASESLNLVAYSWGLNKLKEGNEEIATKINSHTKIVSVVHVSNVLGVTNPVKKLGEAAHAAGDAVGMAAAIRYIQSIGLENIEAHDRKLAERIMAGIRQQPHAQAFTFTTQKKRLTSSSKK